MQKNTKTILIILGIVGGIFALISVCCAGIVFLGSQGESGSSIGDKIDYVPFDSDPQISITRPESGESCDDTTSDFMSFHGVEKTIVSYNPCKVMWILAQPEEEYTVQSANGKTMYVTVYRDYENNVKPGTTFTIRALDMPYDHIGDGPDANVSVTRWVPSEAELEGAKMMVDSYIGRLEI